MKDYNEMAQSVLERRDRYVAQQRARRNSVLRLATAAACVCLAVGYGVETYCKPDVPSVKLPGVEKYQGTQDMREERVWFSEDELLEQDDGNMSMGVFIPSFAAYRGSFYAHTEADAENTARFAPAEEELWFNPEYRHKVYLVREEPDCIAILLNGGMQIYEKQFDVTFEMGGMLYGIEYAPVVGADRDRGDKVLDGDGFTVYRSVSESTELSGEYLVDIMPLLKASWPDLFGDDQEHAEAWQIARPLGQAVVDVPVVENPGSTGALVAYDEFWGGSYMDEQGRWVIWLTENTPENQQEVFKRNPELNKESTIFKKADYSYAYLTTLLADISKAMGNNELPFVPTAALREERNRVEVSVTTRDEESIAAVLAYDTIGGAIEIKDAVGFATQDLLVIKK